MPHNKLTDVTHDIRMSIVRWRVEHRELVFWGGICTVTSEWVSDLAHCMTFFAEKIFLDDIKKFRKQKREGNENKLLIYFLWFSPMSLFFFRDFQGCQKILNEFGEGMEYFSEFKLFF